MAKPIPDPEARFTLDAGAVENAATDRPPPGRPRPSRRNATLFAVLALLVGVVGYYFWPRGTGIAPEVAVAPPAPPAPPPAVGAKAEPEISHPIDLTPGAKGENAAPAPAPLPKLDDSDAVAMDSIAAILNGDRWMRLLVPEGIIRHIVATVDNLPRKTLAPRLWPAKPVPGTFQVTWTANSASIAADNAKRYADLVNAAEAINTARLAGFYVRLYPLFQQAYVELGYPNGYFNDRLIAVIDHLLAAPEPKDPVALRQPKVVFQYADPDLEERSAGQKIMMRVGADNERRLKAKLRDLRRALVADAPKQ